MKSARIRINLNWSQNFARLIRVQIMLNSLKFLPAIFLFLQLFYVQIKTLTVSDDSSKLQLRHVHLLFRHGDRSPITQLTKICPNFSLIWPSGEGQLTDIGIRQHFVLGRWLRNKYRGFVPIAYNLSFYHMRSTDIDRTLMSAMANLAGFYMESKSPLIDYGVKWIPVPVHTVPEKSDVLMGIADCPRLKLLHALEMNSPESIAFENQHSKLFNVLSKFSGLTAVNRSNVWKVDDQIVCMKAHNVTLPEWLSEELVEELSVVNTFYWNKKYASTSDIIRLEIGVFLHSFVQHINSLIRGNSINPIIGSTLSTEHIMAYSAHDTDVTFLLSAFGVYDKKRVPYASTVLLELYGPPKSTNSSDYYLKLMYKKGWKDEVGEYLTIPTCENHTLPIGCPLNIAIKQIEPLLLRREDYDEFCSLSKLSKLNNNELNNHNNNNNNNNNNNDKPSFIHSILFILVGIFLSVILLFMIVLTYTFHTKNYRNISSSSENIMT